jgi:glucokinase
MFVYFDIGGTKTRIAISLDGQSFDDPIKFDTPKDYEEGIKKITEVVQERTNGTPIAVAGGGIAGPVDPEHTMLINSPNLPHWIKKPLTQDISTALGCPVYIRNDTAIVGLGEAHHGAGKGSDNVAYITVSTGVGGARIVDGYLDKGVYNLEPGHQTIDFDKTACEACKSTSVEDYLSGTATAHRFGVKAYEVKDPAVWEQLSHWMALFLKNTILHWSPRTVVLGGSMIVGDPAIPVDRIRDHLRELLHIYPEIPDIKRAELEDLGGLFGAMTYVNQKQKELE